jgi:hypothetical protein
MDDLIKKIEEARQGIRCFFCLNLNDKCTCDWWSK